MLVQGTDDVMVDPGDAARLAAHAQGVGHADVAMLPGQGHGFEDHAATVAAVVACPTRVA